MKKPIVLLVAMLIATPALGVILVGHNPDVNNGGLTTYSGGQPTTWTMAGSGVPGDQANDRLGPDGADLQVGGTWNQNYGQTYTQTFAVPAGTWDIHLEGWTKVWSGNWGAASAMEATITLLVDGSPVWTSPSATWDTWVQQVHDVAGVAVAGSIGVELYASAAGGDGPWSHCRFDDVELSYVPEPTAALGLLMGLPLLLWTRRRR
jgi:hypothetical protein